MRWNWILRERFVRGDGGGELVPERERFFDCEAAVPQERDEEKAADSPLRMTRSADCAWRAVLDVASGAAAF